MHSQAIESKAARAFSLAAADYDEVTIGNPIVMRLRARAQRRMLVHWKKGDRILELNSGTGADAVFLGTSGIRVLATDISRAMVERAETNVFSAAVHEFVETKVLGVEQLDALAGDTFDGALSMFGGLNCVEDLPALARRLASLLPRGGVFLACFIGKHSLWETSSFLRRGRLRHAFRRLARGPLHANVEGISVPVRYWSVPEITRSFQPHFSPERIEGWSVISPPQASLRLLSNHPRLCENLFSLEERLASQYPLNRLGDHTVVELRRV